MTKLRVGMKIAMGQYGEIEGHIARRLTNDNFVLFWIDHPLATSRCSWSYIEEATESETLEYRSLWIARWGWTVYN